MKTRHFHRSTAALFLVVGLYAVVSLFAKPGPLLSLFGNSVQAAIQIVAVAAMLWNMKQTRRHQRAFWGLMTSSAVILLVVQMHWICLENFNPEAASSPYFDDLFTFLFIVPILAAVSLQPHSDFSRSDYRLQLGHLDLALLVLCWIFLYGYFAAPWQFVELNGATFGTRYNILFAIESLTIIVFLGVLWLRAKNSWRTIYGHLLGAMSLGALAALFLNTSVDTGKYYTGSIYDVPLVAALAWLAYVPLLALRVQPPAEPRTFNQTVQAYWHSRIAATAVLTMPLFAMHSAVFSNLSPQIRNFRLLLTLFSMMLLMALLFAKQSLMDRKLIRLLKESRDSYENLRRLQGQMVQAEKLASIGRLVSGAAHEINNPLTAILGYADLLAADHAVADEHRQFAEKIRQQTRRTKSLVGNLITFAKHAPMQHSLVDLNAVVISALQLRELDLAHKKIETVLDLQSGLAPVMGDENHLLQVCFHLFSNAVDAMLEASNGGTLTVSTRAEDGRIVFRCSDTGPGVAEPDRVFDPFYTTKAVGKGTGLGLSACYGVVRDHGGEISCHNRPGGGATFVISLPVAKVAAASSLS